MNQHLSSSSFVNVKFLWEWSWSLQNFRVANRKYQKRLKINKLLPVTLSVLVSLPRLWKLCNSIVPEFWGNSLHQIQNNEFSRNVSNQTSHMTGRIHGASCYAEHLPFHGSHFISTRFKGLRLLTTSFYIEILSKAMSTLPTAGCSFDNANCHRWFNAAAPLWHQNCSLQSFITSQISFHFVKTCVLRETETVTLEMFPFKLKLVLCAFRDSLGNIHARVLHYSVAEYRKITTNRISFLCGFSDKVPSGTFLWAKVDSIQIQDAFKDDSRRRNAFISEYTQTSHPCSQNSWLS